jgi:hypothetical protein
VDLAQGLLKEAGFLGSDAQLALTRTYDPGPYKAQWRASRRRFFKRLAAFAGIGFYIAMSRKKSGSNRKEHIPAMVLFDHNSPLPKPPYDALPVIDSSQAPGQHAAPGRPRPPGSASTKVNAKRRQNMIPFCCLVLLMQRMIRFHGKNDWTKRKFARDRLLFSTASRNVMDVQTASHASSQTDLLGRTAGFRRREFFSQHFQHPCGTNTV